MLVVHAIVLPQQIPITCSSVHAISVPVAKIQEAMGTRKIVPAQKADSEERITIRMRGIVSWLVDHNSLSLSLFLINKLHPMPLHS